MANRPVILSAATYIEGLVLLIDGFPSERHVVSTRVGSESIEEGTRISDHVTPMPALLKLTGIVSDLGGAQRPTNAWQEIRRIHRAGLPVRVITEWGIYPRMVIERCEAHTAARGMRFDMDLREILIVAAPPPPLINEAPGIINEALRYLGRPTSPTAAASPIEARTRFTQDEIRQQLVERVAAERVERGRQQLLQDRLAPGLDPARQERLERLEDDIGSAIVANFSPEQLRQYITTRREERVAGAPGSLTTILAGAGAADPTGTGPQDAAEQVSGRIDTLVSLGVPTS